MIRLALWILRRELRRAERRIDPCRFDRALSKRIDALAIAVEAIEGIA